MAKQSGYLQRLAISQNLRDERTRDFMRTFILDVVTITLGEIGFSPADLEYFRDEYMKMEDDFMDEVLDDFYGNKDKNIWVAKDHIDSALRQYVSEDMFVPYDERYAYCAERKRQ